MEVECASFLAFVPRYRATTEAQKASSVITYKLKNNEILPEHRCTASSYIVRLLDKHAKDTPIARFFRDRPILAPVPSSHMTGTSSLRVPRVLAAEMARCGLGSKTVECLKRTKNIRKSATSGPGGRPEPSEHYESLGVETCMDMDNILLVDDVVTRGSTILGAANIMKERFPNAQIKGFAAVNTVFNHEFTRMIDPKAGYIRFAPDGKVRKQL